MTDRKHRFYNARLKSFATGMRNRPTLAEKTLWHQTLQNGKMLGFRFTRQRPVLNYIADFMCPRLNLIVEVDGLTHQWDQQQDVVRDTELARHGFTVLRFTDDQVLHDGTNVTRHIEHEVERLAKEWGGTPP